MVELVMKNLVKKAGLEAQFHIKYTATNTEYPLARRKLAELYNVDVRGINYHIGKVFEDSELDEEATIQKLRIVQSEGSRQISCEINHCDLQMIVAVGFKVNNERAVQFRKWANTIVKDYTIKGWVMDDERLKNGGTILTEKYFEEQLEKVREIRLSEQVALVRKFVEVNFTRYGLCADIAIHQGELDEDRKPASI